MMQARQQKLGFIWLGRMGGPIAGRLLEAWFELVVHDSNPLAAQRLGEAGASVQDSPEAVGHAACIVLTCLPTPEIVRTVVIGPGGVVGGRGVHHVVDLSTTGPRVAREMATRLAEVGKTLIDAPVTGGVAGARSGSLTMMLGASAEAVEAARPVLETVAQRLLIAGTQAGDGQMLKVINNLLSFVALEATAEAMALGVKAGLDPETMLRSFNTGTGRNSATEEKFPRAVMTRSFDFGFPVRGVMKDIGLCLSEAEAMGVPMPVGVCARQIWTMAMAENADHDMTTIVKLFERWAGVEVKASPAEARPAVALG